MAAMDRKRHLHLDCRSLAKSVILVFVLGLWALTTTLTMRASPRDSPNTGMADAIALERAFDRFASSDDRTRLTLSLANLRGASSEAMNAGGTVTVDLVTGTVSLSVFGLPADGAFELWLVDNHPGPAHSTLAEEGDDMMKVPFEQKPGTRTVSTGLGAQTFDRFFPDRAFLVRAGETPMTSFVLTGAS